MIKSFQEINTNKFTIMVEENPLSDIYNEIVLTPLQEEKIIEIIRDGQVGDFTMKCRTHRYTIIDYVDIAED